MSILGGKEEFYSPVNISLSSEQPGDYARQYLIDQYRGRQSISIGLHSTHVLPTGIAVGKAISYVSP